MNLSKFKAFLCVYALFFIPSVLFVCSDGSMIKERGIVDIIIVSAIANFIFVFLFGYLFGVNKFFEKYFNDKYYRKQDDINWERGLGRTIRETQAINDVKLDFMAKENELKLKYLMSVAQIQIESNQYLMSLYEQARLNQRQNNQSLAHQQLALIEEELRKQGYNL